MLPPLRKSYQMNDSVKTKREPAESVAVKMDDGRTVDFVGKRRMLKEGITIDGQPALRMDFSNGETRQYIITDDMLDRMAMHGAAQKFGDETSGLDDVEDCIIAVDALADRLAAGNWGIVRTNNGMAGTSVLARALAESSGKSMDEVKRILATKTQGEKVELRRHPKIAPIVARLEAAKVSKTKPVHNIEGILDELGLGGEETVAG